MPSSFFFFNDTATTEIYTLSLHDALPIYSYSFTTVTRTSGRTSGWILIPTLYSPSSRIGTAKRSEEHTSELQSPCNLVCRLLLEKKKRRTCSPCARRRWSADKQHRGLDTD